VVPASRILANDLDKERLALMAEDFKVTVFNKNFEVAQKADIIIIAVKPGDVEEVVREIAPEMKGTAGEGKLLISVAAGVRIAVVLGALGTAEVPVVRAMPNLPVVVRQGVTGLVAAPGVGHDHIEAAGEVFKAVGSVVFIEDEPLMDAVTGLSGSGPAYIYLVLEAMIEGGVAEGIPEEIARTLVLQTALGSAVLALDPKLGAVPEELREMVTSPGGTTIEGLKKLEEAGVKEAVKEAVKAATKRARELSGQA
jgi:pyrroline-5-carboxylate reductase